jgi:hypothetical protein
MGRDEDFKKLEDLQPILSQNAKNKLSMLVVFITLSRFLSLIGSQLGLPLSPRILIYRSEMENVQVRNFLSKFTTLVTSPVFFAPL